MSTSYVGTPRLSFTAGFLTHGDDLQRAWDELPALLPGGGFEPAADTDFVRSDGAPIVDITYPGVAEGSVVITVERDITSIQPAMDLTFEIPASLEPFLIG